MASVRFVGSGDAFGSGGRLQTCILVADGGWRCLIDCGTTSLIGLKAAGINPASIDVIVISHLHGDHFGGLPFWLLDAQLNNRRNRPLIIAGHHDLEQRLRSTTELLFPGSQRALEVVPVDFVQLQPGASTRLGAASVEAFAVEHFCGSPPFAVRVTTPTGRIVAYSGDTEWTDTLIDASRGADVFIAEAYFFEKKIKWHLDYATLEANLSKITARRTIATHMSADVLSRLDELEVTAANDGLVLDL